MTLNFSTCNMEDDYINYLIDVWRPLTEKGNNRNMTTSTTIFVPGTIYWPKIVGYKALVDNYERTGKEWAYELVPDDTAFLKEHRLLDRLKDKEDPKNPDKGEFLLLRKPELNRDGERNDPINIYDKDGSVWNEDTLLGNGTRVVAKLIIKDCSVGKNKSIYTNALRIEEHVPYTSDAFAGYDDGGATEKKMKKEATSASAKAKRNVELDDDLPF